MKMLRCLPILALLVAGCPAAQPEPVPTDAGPKPVVEAAPVTVTLRVTGFRSEAGVARVAVFRSADGFPADHTKAAKTWVGKIQGDQIQILLLDLAPGVVAFAVIHDENDNGRLDTNLLGVPVEGFGVSNDPAPTMGPPSFAQGRFELDPDDPVVEIEMRYF